MSKLIKVIADILLILFIVCAAAIFVPPLLGVTTAIATPEVTTNMAQGTVAYGKRVPLEELSSGDILIYNGDNYALLCEVESVDLDSDIVTVEIDGNTQRIQYHDTAAKSLFTVPFIGYMSIALQTMEGRIILGLIAALIVVLIIVGEVWGNKEKDDREYEQNEEEEDDEYFRGLARKSQNRPEPAESRSYTYDEAPRSDTKEIDPFAAADAGIGGFAAASTMVSQKTEDIERAIAEDHLRAERELAEESEHISEETVEEAAEEETKEQQKQREAAERKERKEAEKEAARREKAEREKAEYEAARREKAERKEAEKEAARREKAERKEAEKEAARREKAEREMREEAAAVMDYEPEPANDTAAVAAAAGAAAAGAAVAAAASSEAARKPIYEGEDFSDIDDSQMGAVESALETALDKVEETDNADHSAVAAMPQEESFAAAEAEESPDEIELAIPVRTLEEFIQEAYTNGEDPHIRKDPTTGITLVDFSESFK